MNTACGIGEKITVTVNDDADDASLLSLHGSLHQFLWQNHKELLSVAELLL
jgi:hypothetical protein